MRKREYQSDQEQKDHILGVVRTTPGINFEALWLQQTAFGSKEDLVNCTGELRNTGQIIVMGDGKGRGYYPPDADTSTYQPPKARTRAVSKPAPNAKPAPQPAPVAPAVAGPMPEVKQLALPAAKQGGDRHKPYGRLTPETIKWAIASVLFEHSDLSLSLDVIYHRAVKLDSRVKREAVSIYLNQLALDNYAMRTGHGIYKWGGNYRSLCPPADMPVAKDNKPKPEPLAKVKVAAPVRQEAVRTAPGDVSLDKLIASLEASISTSEASIAALVASVAQQTAFLEAARGFRKMYGPLPPEAEADPVDLWPFARRKAST